MDFFKRFLNKKSTTRINKEKLNSILQQVEFLAKSHDLREQRVIFYIVKIYADLINSERNLKLLNGENPNNVLDCFLTDSSYEVCISDSFYINLGKVPVITEIWNKERQIKALSKIGDYENVWIEHPTNHFFKVFLPIGLTVVHNGNHSSNCGIIKSTGHLELAPNKPNAKIYDISHLYSKLYFDGKYYRENDTKEVIKPTRFEYGCLFEIGRIISKYELSFLKLFNF